MSKASQTKREKELATEIRSMMGLAKKAEARESWTAAVAARKVVTSLRSDLDRLRSERAAEAVDDPLERVQRLRRLATEAGSYTSAGALAKLEQDILDARANANRGAQDDLEDSSDEEILGMVLAAIRALPDTLVVQIRDACVDRLDGGHLRLIGE